MSNVLKVTNVLGLKNIISYDTFTNQYHWVKNNKVHTFNFIPNKISNYTKSSVIHEKPKKIHSVTM